jgi:hypothetical protein
MAAPTNDLGNENLPALFWDALPDNPEEHPDYAGLLAVDDESTPDERAHTLKVCYQPPHGASARVQPRSLHHTTTRIQLASELVRIQHPVSWSAEMLMLSHARRLNIGVQRG